MQELKQLFHKGEKVDVEDNGISLIVIKAPRVDYKLRPVYVGEGLAIRDEFDNVSMDYRDESETECDKYNAKKKVGFDEV